MKKLFTLLLSIAATSVFITPSMSLAQPTSLPSVGEISLSNLPVCYDFGCKTRSTVSLSPKEWSSIAAWFSSGAETPAEERKKIKKAIGWMEVVIGRHTPTHKDVRGNLPAGSKADLLFPGQLDCIDEAVNTTTYLRLFEMHDLLKYHTVIKSAYRKALFDQHWAGQIRDNQSNVLYVVDSWFQPNGYLPVVQRSNDWLARRTFIPEE